MKGREWIVEAFGCEAERLRDLDTMKGLFAAMIRELSLHPVAEAQWHVFPEPGGITGVCILAESHLTVHTFPEHGSLCLNLFCCTERAEWDFGEKLRELVGASAVNVRMLERDYVALPVSGRA